MQQKYGEDKIKITLLHHNSYNALLWDKTDLISSREIFSVWSLSLHNLKVKYPKHKLVKHLSSSLWGQLITYNYMFCDEDQVETYDISEKDSLEHTEYKIIKENRYYRGRNLKVYLDIVHGRDHTRGRR